MAEEGSGTAARSTSTPAAGIPQPRPRARKHRKAETQTEAMPERVESAPERGAVNIITEPQRSVNVPVATGHGLSFWGVLALALAITVLVGAAGQWSGGFWVALGVLVIIGAIWPPIALLFGGLVLLYLALVHGQTFLKNVSNLISPPKPALDKPAPGGGTV